MLDMSKNLMTNKTTIELRLNDISHNSRSLNKKVQLKEQIFYKIHLGIQV